MATLVACSTLMLSILDVGATSLKRCAFTTSYIPFGNLSLFDSYEMLMRHKKAASYLHIFARARN